MDKPHGLIGGSIRSYRVLDPQIGTHLLFNSSSALLSFDGCVHDYLQHCVSHAMRGVQRDELQRLLLRLR